ncbi:hypothetical protein ACRB68_41520 [Actinomadura sp. RB68]|uniref:Uncharacterized protein n=1 Tax=Actinomadura macrotermitis TaxID=2585200 RepID=A0A7K0BYY5_9ACTN|nr:hypothetical protein [Actinomadura macrotermitis]
MERSGRRCRLRVEHIVLGALLCVVALLVIPASLVIRSVAGMSFDPHGYGLIFGVIFAAPLALLAVVLSTTYVRMRQRRK